MCCQFIVASMKHIASKWSNHFAKSLVKQNWRIYCSFVHFSKYFILFVKTAGRSSVFVHNSASCKESKSSFSRLWISISNSGILGLFGISLWLNRGCTWKIKDNTKGDVFDFINASKNKFLFFMSTCSMSSWGLFWPPQPNIPLELSID